MLKDISPGKKRCMVLRRYVPSGLAECQVHQLMPGTNVGCGLPNTI